MNANGTSSTRPYLIRALYEWCSDNGLTPYVAVRVDDTVRVPREYVKDGEIVLNISMDATSALKLGNDYIEFKARFAGVPRDIMIPVARVMAIYARENGQGMAFPLDEATEPEAAPVEGDGMPGGVTATAAGAVSPVGLSSIDSGPAGGEEPEPPKSGGAGARPALKRVK
jgi:stringent starvation protein B